MEEHSPYIPSEASGWITPTIINREDILDKIHRAVTDSSGQTWVFFITGPGGIGKTRLVQEVLNRCRWNQEKEPGPWYNPDELYAAREPIDLYHAFLHSEEGLARTIREVVDPGPGYFEDYQMQGERYQRAKQDLALITDELLRLRAGLTETFLEDYSLAAQNYRLVLALDTAEVIVEETDPIQQEMILTPAWAGVQRWLVERFAPQIENTVLLIAGRPEASLLDEQLSQIPHIHYEKVELGPFQEEDTLRYFAVIIEEARQKGETEVADRLAAVPEETRRVIHLYTGGQPILLALMIDYLAMADQLLPAIQAPLAEARQQAADSDRLEQIQYDLEADLVRVFQETGRETDETLRLLAWTRRGMDAELLAAVTRPGQTATQADIEQAEAALEKVRQPPLSFIKIRPRDNRVFLHDELYELLNKHVLSRTTEERRNKINRAILAYYQARVERIRREIEVKRPTGQALAEIYDRLYSAQVDEVYYHLRYDPLAGFQTYYRYAEEAYLADISELDQQLRAELQHYMRQAEETDPIRRVAEQDLIVRLVKWEIQEARWDQVIHLGKELRLKRKDLFTDPLPNAELSVYEGRALTYQGRPEQAEEKFKQAFQLLQAFQPTVEFQQRQINVLVANLHTYLGYAYRSMGRMAEAISEYRRALPYWRDLLELRTEYSNTLNNLGWALAQNGEFFEASLYTRDGLRLRQALGSRYLIALSLNTLGRIEIEEDRPLEAAIHCKRAWDIFRDLEQARGIGLASIGRAIALRRQTAIPDLHDIADRIDLLNEAEQYAREAVRIFTKEHPEPMRLYEALIEQGCIYRDWARIDVPYDHARPDYRSSQYLAQQSEHTLRRAAREAAGKFIYLQMDAWVNLAWLHYYMDRPDQARQIIETEVLPLIPEYLVSEEGLPVLSNPIASLWMQLGKGHNLLGVISFEKFETALSQHKQSNDPTEKETAYQYLKRAIEEWSLALTYDRLFSADPGYSRRRDLDWIHARIVGLNREELAVVRQAAGETAEKYSLPHPTIFEEHLEATFGEV